MTNGTEDGSNPLIKLDDAEMGRAGREDRVRRRSHDRIYESMMRGGGESFGAPFALGVQSLTEKIVALFRQRGFFGFETLEHLAPRNRRNKFTRYGAARFRGSYSRKQRKPGS